jgi:hypothetical protein
VLDPHHFVSPFSVKVAVHAAAGWLLADLLRSHPFITWAHPSALFLGPKSSKDKQALDLNVLTLALSARIDSLGLAGTLA